VLLGGLSGGRPKEPAPDGPEGPVEGAGSLARRSIRHGDDRQPLPVEEDTRSTGRGLGGVAPVERPEDDVPDDDEPENEPPIERSDGQVYGG
jgi:hypothetical protein